VTLRAGPAVDHDRRSLVASPTPRPDGGESNREGLMAGLRKRTVTVLLIACAVLGVSAAGVYAGSRGDDTGHMQHPAHHGGGYGFPPNVDRVNLSG
jgi:hypothetical protein